MTSPDDYPTVDLANLAEVLLTRLPEAGAWFDEFVEPGTPRSFGWDDVGFDAYQFVLEVFTEPLLKPAVTGVLTVPGLLDRCSRFAEAMITSRSELVRDVAWFDVLEPLLDDVAFVRGLRAVAGPETGRQLEKLIRVYGVTGID